MRKRRAISTSQAEDWAECPWKYREMTIFRKPGFVSDPMEFGRVEHDALQALVTRMINDRREMAGDIIPEVWADFIRNRELREGGIRDKQFGRAYEVLSRFARSFKLDLEHVWKPEAEVSVKYDGTPCGWFDEDVFLRGKLDLTYIYVPGSQIQDFKTAWVPITNAELKASRQAKTYPMLLNKIVPDITYATVKFVYVRWDAITRTADFVEQDFRECWDWWLATSDQIERALDAIRSDSVWKPTPGPWCYNCEVADRCPLVVEKKTLQDLVLMTPEAAAKAGGDAFAHEGAAKLLKAKVRAWVDAHGEPVAAPGGTYGFHRKGDYEYDNAKAVQLAQEYNIPASEFMKVDREKATAKKFMRNYPLLGDELANICKDSGSVEFKYLKDKSEG